jgi:hypothetical protein
MSTTLAPGTTGGPAAVRSQKSPGRLKQGVAALLGWSWRILAGAFLCFNVYLLSYLTSVLVVGWFQRWTRARVVRGWWKQSPLRNEMPLEVLCAEAGHSAPVRRPRWFLPERSWTPALWLNFKTGFLTLLCTYLVIGWGCALMTFGWEFGWLNSFTKGYELAAAGPLCSLAGIALFVTGMLYVPMGLVHMAATADTRSFFDVRFVWKLVQARLFSYCLLAVVILLVALPLEILKLAPLYLYNLESWRTADNTALLALYREYLFSSALVLFFGLLLTHALAARVYGRAVLAALRSGALSEEDLHPELALWLRRLEVLPEPVSRRRNLAVAIVRWGLVWWIRRCLYVFLVVVWLSFVAKVYVGEFFNYHPFVGFMNHPLLQFPCVEYIPRGLQFPQ